MGVFSKLKGIFYDEVEVEEDDSKELDKVSKIVKKETKQENTIPKIEEVKYKPLNIEEEVKPEVVKEENTFNERELFRSERTFNFVDFGDDLEEEKPSRRNVLNEQNRNPKIENPAKEVASDTNKVFKPTPVISPIWGVLDKDYKKDEIKEKNITTDKISSSITSYDTVRRKAYGTLEDELEDTLNSINKLTTDAVKKEAQAPIKKEEVKKPTMDVDLLEQKTQKIENLISKIEEATNDLDKTMSIGELEDAAELENFDETNNTVSDKTLTDNTLEHDLFNLIDSMYDDKEE